MTAYPASHSLQSAMAAHVDSEKSTPVQAAYSSGGSDIHKLRMLVTESRVVWQQAVALAKKDAIIRVRGWRRWLVQACAAIALVVLVWLIDLAYTYSEQQGNGVSFSGRAALRHPPDRPIGPIPDCRRDPFIKKGPPCYSVLYSPMGQPLVEGVMDAVRMGQDPALPRELLKGMSSAAEVSTFLWENPQVALSAVHFRVPSTASSSGKGLSFVLQTNSSLQYFKGQYTDPNLHVLLPLQVAVERAIARLAVNDSSLPWQVSLRDFPHPSLAGPATAGRVAPVFMLAALMLSFVATLSTLVGEREAGVVSALGAMGLRPLAYWTASLLPMLADACMLALLLAGMAAGLGFELALRNAWSLTALLLITTAMSLTCLAVLFSVLLRARAGAAPASFGLYLVAWVMQLVVSLGFPFSATIDGAWVWLFSTVPWTLLSKGFADLAAASAGTYPGIRWSERHSYCLPEAPPIKAQLAGDVPNVDLLQQYKQYSCVMPVGDIYWVQLMQAGAYLLLAWWLHTILPDEDGAVQPAWTWAWMRPSAWTGAFKSACVKRVADAMQHAEARMQQHALTHGSAAGTAGLRVVRDTYALEPEGPSQAKKSPVGELHGTMGHTAGKAGADTTAELAASTTYGALSSIDDADVLEEALAVQKIARQYIASCTVLHGGKGDSATPATAHHSTAASVCDAAGKPAWTQGIYIFGLRKVYRKGSMLEWMYTAPTDWMRTAWQRLRNAVGSRKTQASNPFDQPPAAALHQDTISASGDNAKDELARDDLASVSGAASAKSTASKDFVAVDGIWMHLMAGQCMCLLGPNGAGKTTTLKCLIGALAPSSGDALVWGGSVCSRPGLAHARALAGVCPQFDVLWPGLSGREHLLLMAGLRGLPRHEHAGRAQILLDQVRLSTAADRPASSYSGGMRRRLSVAMALMGDPRVVYLDEPTTGMDIVARRHVWDLLSSAKAGRVMVLTTHSMEEAEVLGDVIALMAGGRLRALGPALHLKQRWGDGYKLSIALHQHLAEPRADDQPLEFDGVSQTTRVGCKEGAQPPLLLLLPCTGQAPPVGDQRLNMQTQAPSGAIVLQSGGQGSSMVQPLSQQPSMSMLLTAAVQGQGTASQLTHTASADTEVLPSEGGTVPQGLAKAGCVWPADEEKDAGKAALASCRPSSTVADRMSALQAEAQRLMGPGLQLTMSSSHLHLQVPRSAAYALPDLFDALQGPLGRRLGVCDLQLALTPLEQVYMNVVQQVEQQDKAHAS